MVFRVYSEKKHNYDVEADNLRNDIIQSLGINSLTGIRIINRYDVENISPELFNSAKNTVFSEPQVDNVSDSIEYKDAAAVFAVEYLPGQFDQRADSAAQCIQLISQCDRPVVRYAKVYVVYGDTITKSDIERIKKHVINPVEASEATLDEYKTLNTEYSVPDSVAVLNGFSAYSDEELENLRNKLGLAMDFADISFCRYYFEKEKRDPTITEIKMLDTYWSDHCRHTTFNTIIDNVIFSDKFISETYDLYLDTREKLGRKKPQTLMDIATLAVKALRKQGKLDKLDQSKEINACTVKIKANVNGCDEDWLLLFKNETHNHPTEIEPFGGAATCIGGAIRDPLSGRAYVYGAMRLTGASDPLVPANKTTPGKLPQKKIVTTAAHGYSSYGNQIGLATGIVDEIYHPGYTAKHMELGAVIAAVPEKNVRREEPLPGDIVILLGGKTGRDGCGGATGSSKSHNTESLENCGAEVQKGNAPEERKLQRLFRNPEASLMIKRSNDFGAGGVSVAIGELADGLDIDLNLVPKKYDGLDGTELAISESQERMAVVISPSDRERFCALANSENIEATHVATVTESPRLVMRWNGKKIVDISREFIDTNGADKHIVIEVPKTKFNENIPEGDFRQKLIKTISSLNVCSKRGLSERFDSTIGASSVLMPYGGKYQLTPSQAMVQKLPVRGETDTVSFMSWGYNPDISFDSPYHGAYLAVVESVAKLVASGAEFTDVYLTFQEYFEKPMNDPKRWGKPMSALLGAFRAQMELGIGAIGGKDSMSGSFNDIDVPPTLVSFAVTDDKLKNTISPDFKTSDNRVVLIEPLYDENHLPVTESLIKNFSLISKYIRQGKIISAWTPVGGGIAEGIVKMCFGNKIGFKINDNYKLNDLFAYKYGAFILEVTDDTVPGVLLGFTTDNNSISFGGTAIPLNDLLCAYENKLESVYPCNIKQNTSYSIYNIEYNNTSKIVSPRYKALNPRVLIPVFPGTNCEYDSRAALERAGCEGDIFVIRNLTPSSVTESIKEFYSALKQSQILFIPGGFSGGDEPEGSGKFITAFLRNSLIADELNNLLSQRDGLVCGICNGFQALIKLGLVPYGEIREPDEESPTLTFNTIGRHQSKIVRTRICSNKSPWLLNVNVGDVYNVPISHGEGRFIATPSVIDNLIDNGQIATQYVNADGIATSDISYNPNNSMMAIEGILSPDGRVFGKMGHSERYSDGIYKNVPGNYNIGMFESAVKYFKQ